MVVECFMRLGLGFILISECGKEFGYWLKLQCFDHKNIGKVKWLEYMKLSTSMQLQENRIWVIMRRY